MPCWLRPPGICTRVLGAVPSSCSGRLASSRRCWPAPTERPRLAALDDVVAHLVSSILTGGVQRRLHDLLVMSDNSGTPGGPGLSLTSPHLGRLSRRPALNTQPFQHPLSTMTVCISLMFPSPVSCSRLST